MLKKLLAKFLPVSIYKKLTFIYHVYYRRIVWKSFNKPKGTLIYVGANIGDSFGKLFFKYNHSYSFEPLIENYIILKRKFGNFKNVKIINSAVSECEGTADFHLSNKSNNYASSSLLKFTDKRNKDRPELKSTQTIKVETTNLESFCLKNKIDYIDLLVLDTEGYDYSILKSIKSLIESKKIREIQCEATINSKDNPYKDIKNYEYLIDELLTDKYEKIATGWANLTPGLIEDLPSEYNFKDLIYRVKT